MDRSYESFIDYCDNMKIANEKLETNILDWTLAKSMTLYHGSDKLVKTIKPTSINMGTRLSGQRKSSFWTNNFDYAVVWSLDWLAITLGIPYMHDINTNRLVFPDADCTFKKDNRTVYAGDAFLEILDKHPLYIYEAEVPTKYIGRGQLPINEYTVDIEVTPKKITKVTREMAKKHMAYDDLDKFNNPLVNNGLLKKSHLNLREKLIFKNPREVMNKRKRLMQ